MTIITPQLNKALLSLLTLRSRIHSLDESDVSGLLTLLPVNSTDGLSVDEAKGAYLREAQTQRSTLKNASIGSSEKFIQEFQEALSQILPHTFEASKSDNTKTPVNTVKFIEFLLNAKVASLDSIKTLSNEESKDLPFFLNHEKFEPLIKASVSDQTAFEDPLFLESMFKNFLGIQEEGNLRIVLQLFTDLHMEKDDLYGKKLDFGKDLILQAVTNHPFIIAGKEDAATTYFMQSLDKGIRSSLYNLGNGDKALTFAHEISSFVEASKDPTNQNETFVGDSYRKLVSDFNLKEIFKIDDVNKIKELYSKLSGIETFKLDGKRVNDLRLAINNHCQELNDRIGFRISTLVHYIDEPEVLTKLAEKLTDKNTIVEKAQSVKDFILSKDCPEYISKSGFTKSAITSLDEVIANPEIPKPNVEATQPTPEASKTKDISIPKQFDDLAMKFYSAVEMNLNDEGKKALETLLKAVDREHLTADQIKLFKENIPFPRETKNDNSMAARVFLSGCQHWGNLDQTNIDLLKQVEAQCWGVELNSFDTFSEKYLSGNKSNLDERFKGLIETIKANISKSDISYEEVSAIEKIPTWKEAREKIDAICIKCCGEDYANLNPEDKLLLQTLLAERPNKISTAAKTKSEVDKSKETIENKITGNGWWDWTCENIPVIGLVSSLVIGVFGGLFTAKANNKKPGILALTIGTVGAIGSGIYMWYNSGSEKPKEAPAPQS